MKPGRSQPSEAGVALVVTLMMMSILTMMVVGLSGVMRNEQAAARNLTYQVLAGQMAESGVGQAMAAVLSNSPTSGIVSVTGPGWTATNGVTVPLFSSNSAGQTVNLERFGPDSLILSVFSGQTGRVTVHWTNVVPPGGDPNLPMGRYAWWVDDEGTKGNLNQIGASKTNPAATTSLLPLQTNLPLNWSILFATQSGLTSGDSDLAGLASRTHRLFSTEMLKDASWGSVVGADVYRNYKGQVTVWSSNADLTPWGTGKLNLADPAVNSTNLKEMFTTNRWTNLFGSNATFARKFAGGSAGATNAGSFGDVILDFVVADLQALRGQPEAPQLNTNNPGANSPLRHRFQIPRRPVGNLFRDGTNAPSLHPYLTEIMASVDSFADTNTITVNLYLQIEVLNPWAITFPANTFQLRILPRKFRFHVTTGSSNSVPSVLGPSYAVAATGTIWPDSFGSSAGLSGTLGCWVGPMMEDGTAWPQTSPVVVPVDTALTSQQTKLVPVNLPWVLTFTGVNPVRVDQAYLMLDQVVLETTGGTVLDWVSLDDFSQAANFGLGTNSYTQFAADTGQIAFNRSTATYPPARRGASYVRVGPTQNLNSFSTNDAQGLGKYDPRVRLPTQVWSAVSLGVYADATFPSSWGAWNRVGPATNTSSNPVPEITPGSPNNRMFTNLFRGSPNALYTTFLGTNPPATRVTNVAADPVAGTITDLLDHPHFVPGYVPTNGLLSVAQIGAAHTGIPWRTLRLLPTPSAELTNGPPDWVLLDVFTVTNSTDPRPMINVNSVGRDLTAETTNRPAILTSTGAAIVHRGWAVAAATGPLINTTNFFKDAQVSSNLATWGVPVSFAIDGDARIAPSGTVITNLGPALARALANPGQTGTNWYTNANTNLNSGWGNYRAAATNLWPTQGMAFRGEMAELPFWTQGGTDLAEDQQEGRLRFFMDLLTTRSDTFTAWSVGQGLVVFTNSLGRRQTNIMGEVRRQTVFQRIPLYATNVVGSLTNLSVTNWRLKVLYSRDHVVE